MGPHVWKLPFESLLAGEDFSRPAFIQACANCGILRPVKTIDELTVAAFDLGFVPVITFQKIPKCRKRKTAARTLHSDRRLTLKKPRDDRLEVSKK